MRISISHGTPSLGASDFVIELGDVGGDAAGLVVGERLCIQVIAAAVALHLTANVAVHALSVAKGHVWTAPSWQGFSSRMQHWSVQPCVRPLRAVHMTAGHNALRGSGPG
ncbi:MAG: hypothetical protein P4L80_03280, partial [Xanthobacteraceae bacterium]|nr:hypothetical protein [Xanthobacteraceae bacterium]